MLKGTYGSVMEMTGMKPKAAVVFSSIPEELNRQCRGRTCYMALADPSLQPFGCCQPGILNMDYDLCFTWSQLPALPFSCAKVPSKLCKWSGFDEHEDSSSFISTVLKTPETGETEFCAILPFGQTHCEVKWQQRICLLK